MLSVILYPHDHTSSLNRAPLLRHLCRVLDKLPHIKPDQPWPCDLYLDLPLRRTLVLNPLSPVPEDVYLANPVKGSIVFQYWSITLTVGVLITQASNNHYHWKDFNLLPNVRPLRYLAGYISRCRVTLVPWLFSSPVSSESCIKEQQIDTCLQGYHWSIPHLLPP